MSFSDDILMAYADGELDQATRHALESAMRRDAVLARRVAQYQAQRRMAAPRRAATVVQLADVRATRAATQQAARKARKLRWSWMEWGALAGVLVLGLAAGRYLLGDWQADTQSPASLAWRDGALVAQGRLALALEQAPGGTAGVYGGGVRIAASFVAIDGSYCRSFTASSNTQDMAGLACRGGGVWKLPLWQQVARPVNGARPAGVDVPAAVQAMVAQRSAGQLLDAAAEQDAMRRGWQR